MRKRLFSKHLCLAGNVYCRFVSIFCVILFTFRSREDGYCYFVGLKKSILRIRILHSSAAFTLCGLDSM